MIPSGVLLTMASSEESTMAASRAVGSGAFSPRGLMCFTIPGIFYRSAPSDLGFDFIWRDVEITDYNWCTGSTLLFSESNKSTSACERLLSLCFCYEFKRAHLDREFRIWH